MIVSPTASSGKKVEKVKKFFNNFNINLTGILLETSSAIEQPKRKKFLGVF
jgi:transcriptional regulator of met regulon